MNKVFSEIAHTNAWKHMVETFALSHHVQNQFLMYINFLLEENKKYDLTAITSYEDIIYYHIEDVLYSLKEIDFNKYTFITDVGSGCGIPGIILACMLQQHTVYLMEILQKRVGFLNRVIELLGLTDRCFVVNQDFKSFVRQGKYQTQLFCARASLSPEDLLFICNGVSKYKFANILYWASAKWVASEDINNKYSFQQYEYTVGDRQRKYVLFTH